MKGSQRGFILPLLLVIGLIVIAGGIYFVMHQNAVPAVQNSPNTSAVPQAQQTNNTTVQGTTTKTSSPKYLLDALGGFSGYAIDSTNVYFSDDGQGDDFVIVPHADPATFSVILGDYQLKGQSLMFPIGKDKNSVYVATTTFPGMDAKSFESLSPTALYSKDMSHVYYYSWHSGMSVIKNADPTTFACLGSCNYAKDKSNVYFEGSVIPGADSVTFTVVNPPAVCSTNCTFGYFDAQDKNHKYDAGGVVQ